MNRKAAIDVFKIVMAIMVVALHTSVLRDVDARAHYVTNNGLFRIAVPSFLLISGYYFHDALLDERQWVWLKRTLVLYAVWMAIYAYFWVRGPVSASRLAQAVVVGYHHLWYVSGLIGAALLMLWTKRLRSWAICMLVGLTFAIGVLVQYAQNYQVTAEFLQTGALGANWIHRNFLFLCYPFFAVGYLIRQHKLDEKVSSGALFALGLIGVGALLLESNYSFDHAASTNGFDNLASLIVVCPVLLLWISKLKVTTKSKQLALYSTAIFFIHPFLQSVLQKVWDPNRLILAAAVVAASTVASFALVRLHRRWRVIL